MKMFIAFFILVLPLACSNSSSSEDYRGESTYMDSPIMEKEMKTTAYAVDEAVPQEQKLIKESYLRFETQDLEATYANISKFIQQNQGFIQDDVSDKSYNQLSRRLIIRIPTDKFQNTIDAISKDVKYFDTKQITSKDVTEEFIDLEARLKAKQTLEARYLELLKKANSVKDILEIERELSTIREEIEAKQGRLKYLENKVSQSTLTVEFYKITSDDGVTVSYGQKMKNAFVAGFNGLSLFFLGLLHIWPFILIIFIGFFILRRWLKKRNAAK